MIQQLGLISAILGGFAFTFLGALLTIQHEKKVVDFTIVTGVLSALIFFICALGWSFLSTNQISESENLSNLVGSKHKTLSILLLFGIFSLTICLALSGWIRSKKTGFFTTLISVLGLIIILSILRDFIS
ncbi:MAG: hypothetical protein IPN97_17655 [Saprospiraceae bacterium]|nr:hypothetical protein [Saprospiraceae bacterium]MBK9044966.1 hypothetical protein [Saprospiraceae bacterium]